MAETPTVQVRIGEKKPIKSAQSIQLPTANRLEANTHISMNDIWHWQCVVGLEVVLIVAMMAVSVVVKCERNAGHPGRNELVDKKEMRVFVKSTKQKKS